MAVRERNEIAVAAVELQDLAAEIRGSGTRERPSLPSPEDMAGFLADLSNVIDRLQQAAGGSTLGVPVSAAASYLQISEPTVRLWMARGALVEIEGSKPKMIEAGSLRRVGHAVAELRAQGQDRDWLRALIDLTHDRAHLADPDVKRGLDELARGEFEPA